MIQVLNILNDYDVTSKDEFLTVSKYTKIREIVLNYSKNNQDGPENKHIQHKGSRSMELVAKYCCNSA